MSRWCIAGECAVFSLILILASLQFGAPASSKNVKTLWTEIMVDFILLHIITLSVYIYMFYRAMKASQFV